MFTALWNLVIATSTWLGKELDWQDHQAPCPPGHAPSPPAGWTGAVHSLWGPISSRGRAGAAKQKGHVIWTGVANRLGMLTQWRDDAVLGALHAGVPAGEARSLQGIKRQAREPD